MAHPFDSQSDGDFEDLSLVSQSVLYTWREASTARLAHRITGQSITNGPRARVIASFPHENGSQSYLSSLPFWASNSTVWICPLHWLTVRPRPSLHLAPDECDPMIRISVRGLVPLLLTMERWGIRHRPIRNTPVRSETLMDPARFPAPSLPTAIGTDHEDGLPDTPLRMQWHVS